MFLHIIQYISSGSKVTLGYLYGSVRSLKKVKKVLTLSNVYVIDRQCELKVGNKC